MSEGPIQKWRDSWLPPRVSTTDSARVCMVKVVERRTHCGRKPERGHQTANWDDVTCSDCKAAREADRTVGTEGAPGIPSRGRVE